MVFLVFWSKYFAYFSLRLRRIYWLSVRNGFSISEQALKERCCGTSRAILKVVEEVAWEIAFNVFACCKVKISVLPGDAHDFKGALTAGAGDWLGMRICADLIRFVSCGFARRAVFPEVAKIRKIKELQDWMRCFTWGVPNRHMH